VAHDQKQLSSILNNLKLHKKITNAKMNSFVCYNLLGIINNKCKNFENDIIDRMFKIMRFDYFNIKMF